MADICLTNITIIVISIARSIHWISPEGQKPLKLPKSALAAKLSPVVLEEFVVDLVVLFVFF